LFKTGLDRQKLNLGSEKQDLVCKNWIWQIKNWIWPPKKQDLVG